MLEVIEVEIKDLEEFIELSKDDPSELDEIKNQLIDTEQKIIDLEEESLYSEEFDNHSAVLTVNAGAGGVDAHDWAEMLFRMYTRFLDNNNMKYEIEEISTGEEAGIKSGSIRIDNYRAYANLESERGVHRLVRISPFDSNKRRHTSFAGVDVVPLIDDSDEFDLNEFNLYDNIKDATPDISYLLATTARIRDMNKPVFNTKDGIEKLLHVQKKGNKTAIIFGGEKSGLNNQDLVKADALININNNKNFSSINLSMSVLIICYEWFLNTSKNNKLNNIKTNNKEIMPNKNELNYFIDRLISILDNSDFFNPDEKRKVMINNIEAIFTRNNLTLQELNTLHGILSSIIRS